MRRASVFPRFLVDVSTCYDVSIARYGNKIVLLDVPITGCAYDEDDSAEECRYTAFCCP